MELWTAKQAAKYWGVTVPRARSILRSRGVLPGYPADAVRAITSKQGQRTDLADDPAPAIRQEIVDHYGLHGRYEMVAAVDRILLRTVPSDATPAPIPPDSRSILIIGATGSGNTQVVTNHLRTLDAAATILTSYPEDYPDLDNDSCFVLDPAAFLQMIEPLAEELQNQRKRGATSEPHVYIIDIPSPTREIREAARALRDLAHNYPDAQMTVIVTSHRPDEFGHQAFETLVILPLPTELDYASLAITDPVAQNVLLKAFSAPESLVWNEQAVVDHFPPNSPERTFLAQFRSRPFTPPVGTAAIRLSDSTLRPLAE